ncbi:MAG: hypothetical protein M1827_003168 [Pycnora praestabilis]|nr:MAG: hypothetical protein M1827_003168 [Pycnora praestabilis]
MAGKVQGRRADGITSGDLIGSDTAKNPPSIEPTSRKSRDDHRPSSLRKPRSGALSADLSLISSCSSSSTRSPVRLPGLRPREDRSSFSSVKEDDCGIAQSFVDSKTSSLVTEAFDDEAFYGNHNHYTDKMATLVALQPPSICCPCGGFRGWKRIRLQGRHMSRSYGDLRQFTGDEHHYLDSGKEPELKTTEAKDEKSVALYPPGKSPLERLPTEIIDQIIPLLALDAPPNDYTPRNIDLISCLLTSRTIHTATLTTLYGRVTIPHSLIFSKFLEHISKYPGLGTIVRRLDFSHFSSVGLGRTRLMNSKIQNVTSATLVKCLELTPWLQEFLVQEHLDDDVDEAVLRKIFCDLPNLRAVDFCASSSSTFRTGFEAVINVENKALPRILPLQRLSLHDCTTLPASTLEVLLPRLPHLTHLDVSHTQITNKALSSIPESARLTHLNLSRCTQLLGEGVVDFLTTHPAAARKTLVYLNLLSDTTRYRLLEQADVEILLPQLPSTLRALNLSGAKIKGAHVPLLQPLTKHLEELSVGYTDLSIEHINSLFIPTASADENEDISMEEANWVPHTLHYLDLTGIPAITARAVFSSSSILLQPTTQPLEVLELGEKIISALRQRTTTSKRLRWVVRECGRRAWYVREPAKDLRTEERDNGKRAWKMGASWWGMRKVPVAKSEVGGLYGHYMFKK